MASNILDNLWIALCNIDFTIENEISNKFKCIICQKLLMEAQSGPCGCMYCLECIRQYLNGKEKFCPGKTDECKEVLVNFDKDVHVDQRMNLKLLKLIVKCPDKSCQYRGQLKTIPDHMRMSNHQLIYSRCPYCDIGCREERVVKDELFTHLNSEILSHSSLMMQWMNNLTNELASLKNEGENLRNENCFLKEEIRDLKADNEERDIRAERKEIEICELQTKLEEKIVEIEQLKVNSQQNRTKLKENQEACKKNLDLVGNTSHKIDFLDTRIDGIEEPMKNMHGKLTEMKRLADKNFCGEFLWGTHEWFPLMVEELDDFEDEGTIFSEPFLSLDGYKMCLELVYRDYYFTASVCIMIGPNDDQLDWPCTHDVTVDFVQGPTLETMVSKTWKYDGSDKYRKRPKLYKNVALPDHLTLCHYRPLTLFSMNISFAIRCTLHTINVG